MSAETTQQQPAAAEFNNSLEQIHQGDIFVINQDEYGELVTLAHEDARDLPDGLYLVDETVRDRLQAMGLDYDALNRGVLSGVGLSSLSEEESEQLKLGRQQSAHHIFFGSIEIKGDNGTRSSDMLIAIKPHVEVSDDASKENAPSAKPFKELGNLALLQSAGQEGVYKPLGILQANGVKFVMTELRPGVSTLDDHAWIARRNRQERSLNPEAVQALYDRDVKLVTKAFELFGDVIGRGIFQGDSQMKNVGWTSLKMEGQEPAVPTKVRLDSNDDVAGVEMTIVDLENATIFMKDGEDFPKAYYDQLVTLATKEVGQFFNSVPKKVRVPRGALQDKTINGTEFLDAKFVQPFVNSFLTSRARQGLGDMPTELVEELTASVARTLLELNNPSPGSGNNKG